MGRRIPSSVSRRRSRRRPAGCERDVAAHGRADHTAPTSAPAHPPDTNNNRLKTTRADGWFVYFRLYSHRTVLRPQQSESVRSARLAGLTDWGDGFSCLDIEQKREAQRGRVIRVQPLCTRAGVVAAALCPHFFAWQGACKTAGRQLHPLGRTRRSPTDRRPTVIETARSIR
jgi:hypothetical protein